VQTPIVHRLYQLSSISPVDPRIQKSIHFLTTTLQLRKNRPLLLTNPKQTATIENNQSLIVRFPKSGGFSRWLFKRRHFSMEKALNEILTVEEAAELLRFPRSTVYKLAQRGKIPAQKVGRHWRFHRATLIDWIAGKNHPEGNNIG
jgi:excisionase family DNA binding protein